VYSFELILIPEAFFTPHHEQQRYEGNQGNNKKGRFSQAAVLLNVAVAM
jgi:hypothetical protein